MPSMAADHVTPFAESRCWRRFRRGFGAVSARRAGMVTTMRGHLTDRDGRWRLVPHVDMPTFQCVAWCINPP